MILQLAELAQSDEIGKLAEELLGWINSIGDKKQRLKAIQAVARVMHFQQRAVILLSSRLEQEGRQEISPVELLGLLALSNEYTFRVIGETADWEGS